VRGERKKWLIICARKGLVFDGTRDVDVVIDLQILANTEAYHTLEENLKKMSFERAENDKGQKLSWRWQARTDHGALMVLELLADAPNLVGGKVRPLPTGGTISALNIPHSSIVFDMHRVIEIEAELLGGNGIVTERIRYANLVSFTCLKVFAFDDRFERKDAHDLIYCIEHAPEGMDAAAEGFRAERSGKHGAVVKRALEILRARFATSEEIQGYRKDGPVAATQCPAVDITGCIPVKLRLAIRHPGTSATGLPDIWNNGICGRNRTIQHPAYNRLRARATSPRAARNRGCLRMGHQRLLLAWLLRSPVSPVRLFFCW
jgi:hypothetical protein